MFVMENRCTWGSDGAVERKAVLAHKTRRNPGGPQIKMCPPPPYCGRHCLSVFRLMNPLSILFNPHHSVAPLKTVSGLISPFPLYPPPFCSLQVVFFVGFWTVPGTFLYNPVLVELSVELRRTHPYAKRASLRFSRAAFLLAARTCTITHVRYQSPLVASLVYTPPLNLRHSTRRM